MAAQSSARLIGDLQTVALVSTDGALDWFCCPRFDSPSVFASLLDADRGGFYRIAPDRDDYVAGQLYLPDTAVLVTRFMTPDAVGVVRGVMRFAIEIQPRFDYGRAPHELEVSEHGAIFWSGGMGLTIHGIAPEGTTVQNARVTPLPAGDGLRWTRTLREGEPGGVALESMGGKPRLVTPRTCSGCKRRPSSSGAAGCAGRATTAAGGSWSPGRPSR